MNEIELKRLVGLTRHIEHVRHNGTILGERLIEKEEYDIGKDLIANVHIHDYSKFHGIEWLYLNEETKKDKPELFKAALTQHITTNPHHPEYWKHIGNMPRVYVAEFICDIKSRSDEFGTDLRSWIKEKATKRFDFTTKTKIYKEIRFFTELLLDANFK